LTWLFGNATVTYYFWPILSSALLAACLYLIAYRFWGQIFGILAVVLGLSSPITFINLTRGYPDIQSTAIVTLAVVLALVIRDRLLSGHRATWWLWLSVGFLLGWGFETRETTILTWPIVAVVLWTRRVSVRGIALLAAGIAVWAVADIVIGAVAYGDPLIRLHVFTNQDLATTTIPGDLAAQQQFVGRNRLYYLGVIPAMLASGGGVWSLVLGALTLVGLVFRGGSRFVSLWFLLCYLTFVGITGGFFPNHPSGRIDVARYWICFLPLAGLAVAGTTAEIAARIGPRLLRSHPSRAASWPGLAGGLHTLSAAAAQRLVNLVLAVLVAIGPVFALTGNALRNPQLIVNGADQLAQLRTFLTSNEPDNPRIMADLATARLLPIYQRGDFGGRDLWSAEVVNLNRYPVPRSGDLVIINSLGSQSCYFCGRQSGTWYEKYGPIPDDWELVWTSDPAHLMLYRVP
jgi:4-amino-4-deoxy-L-arabinose transferase-like glycosyltransferase